MLRRLFRWRDQEKNDFYYMGVKFYSCPGKAKNQFWRRKVVDTQMRDGDAVADITKTLLVTITFFVTQLPGQTGYCGLFTEGLDNLREFAFEAENDLGRLK